MLSSSLKYGKLKYLVSCCTKVFTYYFKFYWFIFTEEGNPLAFFLSSRPYYGSTITHQLFSSGLMFPDIFPSGACCRRFELHVPHPAKSQSRAVRRCRASSEQAGSPHNNTYKEDKISRLPTQNPCGGSISQHPWLLLGRRNCWQNQEQHPAPPDPLGLSPFFTGSSLKDFLAGKGHCWRGGKEPTQWKVCTCLPATISLLSVKNKEITDVYLMCLHESYIIYWCF